MEFLLNNLGLIAAGGAGAGATVVGIKGVPASWAWLKTWWTKGKADLATMKSDFVALEQRVVTLEGRVLPKSAAATPAAAATTAA